MMHFIKQTVHRIRVGKLCEFGKRTTIDSKANFEGKNRLADNVTFLNSSLGYASYIGHSSFVKNTCVGKYCSIGNDVMTIVGNHPINCVSTHPAFYSTALQAGITYVTDDYFDEFKYIDKEKNLSVVIGNDVWIGARVTILEGIKIGDGSVIAAGAVVTKDVLPYTIVGGCPAKEIRKRFDDITIQKLLEYKWWNQSRKWIQDNVHKFQDVELFLREIIDGKN